MEVDFREDKVIKELEFQNIQFSKNKLDVGDFVINSILIIERKSVDDLIASIYDGRYKEQKERLKQSSEYVLYIIEGVSNEPLIKSSILSILLRDKISVVQTNSVKETVEMLNLLQQKMNNNFLNSNNYVVQIPKTKTKDVYIQQLCCIPGINEKIALNIKNSYPNMKALMNENDSKNFLKIPKIGPKLQSKIVETLFT